MKIDRLFAIMMVLLEQKKISATRLAAMFEVSVRTIYRDIEKLGQAGIPVIAWPGINGGIGIIDGYKVDKNLFTTREIVALLAGLHSLTGAQISGELEGTISKVRALIPSQKQDEVHAQSCQMAIDLTPWIGKKWIMSSFKTIQEALAAHRYLVFEYIDIEGKSSYRKVEPYQLVLKTAHWYLRAYCLGRQDFRLFRLSRITNLTFQEHFVPRPFSPDPLNVEQWPEKTFVNISLLIETSIRDQVLEWCSIEEIRPFDANHFLVNMKFSDNDYGYGILLSFRDKCQCLSPPRVREELIRRISSLYVLYHAKSSLI